MDLSNANRFESPILLGIVNEKLRLECGSFDELCRTYDMNSEAVSQKLEGLGYHYDPLTNQFKSR